MYIEKHRAFNLAILLCYLFSPPVYADAADDELGQSLTKCFHPSAKYERVEVDSGFPTLSFTKLTASREGTVFFRGALTNRLYKMDFRMDYKYSGGKVQAKIEPLKDNAPFPPNTECSLQFWFEMK